MGEPTYRIRGADVRVRPDLGCLQRGSGEEIYLRPKTFQTLRYLLEHRDRLVTKEELATAIWRDVAVTDDAMVQCVVEIRKALGDDSREPRYIRTIPKIGYRFVGEIEADAEPVVGLPSSELNSSAVPPPVSAPLLETPKTWRSLAAAVAVVVGIGGGLYWYLSTCCQDPSAAGSVATSEDAGNRKAIAVMALENQSKTESLDWLRQGLADMLVTGLSRSRDLAVMDRRQLDVIMTRAGHAPGSEESLTNAVDIARLARLDHFVLGTFSKLGESIRIDLRVHDASGKVVVTESLTTDSTDQLLGQVDLLALRLVRALGVESETAKPAQVLTSNLQAYRYYSLGVTKANTYHDLEAVQLFTKATELDPQFAMAYARIGYAYGVIASYTDKARPYLEKAYSLTDRLSEKDRLQVQAWNALVHLDYPAAATALSEIVRLYPTDVEAYTRLGVVLAGERRYEEALQVYRRGLAADPQSSELWNRLGGLFDEMGRHDEAIAARTKYVELEPKETNSHDSLGLSLQLAGRHEEAVAEFNRALDLKPDFGVAMIHLGHAYMQMGRYKNAAEAYRQFLDVAATDFERTRGYFALALLERRQGRFAQALALAKKAPRDPLFYPQDTLIKADAGQPLEPLLRQLDETRSGSSRGSRQGERYPAYARGVLNLKAGNGPKAIEHFREALNERSVTWDADLLEDCLANAYLELGRYDEAIVEYQRVLQGRPWYPLAHYRLALAFEKKQRPDDARKEYTEFLRLWSSADRDVPEVVAARARLAALR